MFFCISTSNLHSLFVTYFIEYRFGEPLVDPDIEPIKKQKSRWKSTLDVKCGYGKKWEPPHVEGCVDPRGCTFPPSSNQHVYAEYDGGGTSVMADRRREFNLRAEGKIEEIEVGTQFWYMCNDGKL